MKFNTAQQKAISRLLSELAMAEDKALEELSVDQNNAILRERYNVAHAKYMGAFDMAFAIKMNDDIL